MKEGRCGCSMPLIRGGRWSAILLIGADKTGDNRFYERMIPIADELYNVHLMELKQEGLLK